LENLLTVKEYAEKHGVSATTVYKQIRRGQIKSTTYKGKKCVVVDSVSGELVGYSHEVEVVDEYHNIIEAELKELELLRKRVKELERYTEITDRLMEENRELREENRTLVKKVVEKIEKIEKSREPIELEQYLISNGFTKRVRNRVKNELLLSKDERIIKKSGKIYLDLEKYSFRDILMIQ
jgi:predicted site-specific integrase-resolvase